MIKLYGVLGFPIAHSMSPAMHNDLFACYGIKANYHPFLVEPNNLADAIKGLKAIGAGGFNVTVPHKTAVIPLLDKVDPLAKAIGAVNTVVNEGGVLTGYNTDGRGFVKSLAGSLSSLSDKKALVIGAGGAARAIYFSLAEAGIPAIDICNRTTVKAEQLAAACPFPIATSILEMDHAGAALEQYDLIVQTTSIGMSPDTDQTPIVIKNVKKDSLAVDIIYNPLQTRFLQEAAALGANVQNGIGMFVYQGALSFEKWTGIFPDTDRMKENVLKQLGGSSC